MASRKRKRPGCTYVEQIAYEVQWYEVHGKYPDRIQTDYLDRRIVVCDISWNRRNHYRRETVGPRLANYVAFKVTGIRQ